MKPKKNKYMFLNSRFLNLRDKRKETGSVEEGPIQNYGALEDGFLLSVDEKKPTS